VYLPEIDIDKLIESGVIVEMMKNYGKKTGNIIPDNRNREIIWDEGWEGSLNPYSFGDDNANNGYDYWGDVMCESHSGYWSLWCADEGDQPDCTNYDDNMDAYVEKNTNIIVQDYDDVQFKFWYKNDSESDYDWMQLYYYENGWNIIGPQYTGSSGGWQQVVHNLPGWSYFRWKFVFHSDSSVHNYEGAYLDDLEMTGDPQQTGTITVTMPNAVGLRWAGNLTYVIQWTSSNVPGNVKIDLYKNDNFHSNIITNTNNDGIFDWTIPVNIPNDDDYKILICSLNQPNVYDFSDYYFTIMQAPNLVAPLPGSTVNNPVNLDWDPVIGAQEYTLYVDGSEHTTTSMTGVTSDFSTGMHEWKVLAFYGNSYTEFSDEWSFTVSNPGNPDISIIDIWWEDVEVITQGVEFDFHVLFENIGDETANDIEIIYEGYYNGNWYEIDTDSHSSLEPGENQEEHDNNAVWNYSCGDIQFRVKIPAVEGETNTDNNILEETWYVSPGSGVDDYPNAKSITYLYQNHPNPFNPETSIKYSLHKSEDVMLQIYNTRGELISTLVDGYKPTGIHSVNWKANDISSGIYFYRLSTKNKTFVKKMILMQ